MKPANPADLVLGIVFAAGGTAIAVSASGYASLPGMIVGPGLFPIITGVAMAVFGAVLAFHGWLSPAPVDVLLIEDAAAQAEPIVKRPLFTGFAVGIVAAVAVATALMPALGFLVTGVLFSIAVVLLSGGRWPSAVIFSPIATAAIYALFVYGFRVPLPRGLLG